MSRSPNPQLLSVWQERFTRFASTGLTVAEFCRSEGVSTPSFYRWKKLASPMSSPSPRFVPLSAQTPSRWRHSRYPAARRSTCPAISHARA